jgi:predicted nucleotide-binding protein (sugar kinase/HSP70/actin superfamily)
MSTFSHHHVSHKVGPENPLAGKKVYIPRMPEGTSLAFAHVFRWLGIDAEPTPPSDELTRELGRKVTNGDECYPAIVTIGDFFRAMGQPGFDRKRAVFFMPTAEGPCRFGQYAPYLRKVLDDSGWSDIQVLSPTSDNGYADLGDVGAAFTRGAWRALVGGDILSRVLLKTRPYETVAGAADQAFEESLADFCKTVESSCAKPSCQLESLVQSLRRARERFRRVPAHYDPEVPLIGVVGEIFCRLNTFSNADLVRRLEGFGAEAWLSQIAEWVAYSNNDQVRKLKLTGKSWSLEMLKSKIRSHFQLSDEHALMAPFHEDFVGYEEPDVQEVLDLARPYLPSDGALGDMVLSVGKAAYLARHGADGIIDISPFTCMNGIVTESIYPKISKDFGGIPIRNFYFDGTQSDLDRDLGIYLELARSYREKKTFKRTYPSCFAQPVT